MSQINPTLNQTSFFWRINYYYDVFFSHFLSIPTTKPTQIGKDSRSKIKDNSDSSDRTRGKTIFKLSHQKPVGQKTGHFPSFEVVFKGMSTSELMTLSLLVFEFETKSPKNPMSMFQSATREFSTTVSNKAVRVYLDQS